MANGSVSSKQKPILYLVVLCLLVFSFMLCFQNFSRKEKQVLVSSSCDQLLYREIKDTWRHLTTTFFQKQSSSNFQDYLVQEVVKNIYIDWPPTEHKEYKWSKNPPKIDGQLGMPIIVDKLLEGKRNGFFIEAGGLDGELHANSVFFELERNWTGLLVEPSKDYATLLTRNRKVTSINACLSKDGSPHVVEFQSYGAIGGIKGEVLGWTADMVNKNAKIIKATCFPFHSILFAIGNPSVDYFSLDIEGIELDVLKTIPWDKVDIKIFSIEVGDGDGVYVMGRDNGVVGGYGNEVTKVMESAGYTKILSFCCGTQKNDHVYVRNDFRSPLFKYDGKPRLMKEQNRELFELT